MRERRLRRLGAWLAGAMLLAGASGGDTTRTASQPQGGWPSVELVALEGTFGSITELASAGDGSGRLYVVERRGTVRVFEANGQLALGVFLDLRGRLKASGSEQGLLGLAFSPSFEVDGAFYVNYTDPDGDTVVSRFNANSGLDADESSEAVIFRVGQPFANHNGGHLTFGPDGLLYIGMGDGGSGGDPGNRAQDDNSQLGKMLRYDPGSGAVETVAKGLRNPWKFSFDRATGDLYIADVGQGSWEEVNFVPAGTLNGRNFGWRVMEGMHCYQPAGCSTAGFDLPVYEYSHDDGCSVTGGYVAREAFSDIAGVYVFSDYCSGTIWGLRQEDTGRWVRGTLGEAEGLVTTFGQGEDGALYVAVERESWRVYRVSAGRALPELPFSVVLPGLAVGF